jgi:hypothetical protein
MLKPHACLNQKTDLFLTENQTLTQLMLRKKRKSVILSIPEAGAERNALRNISY